MISVVTQENRRFGIKDAPIRMCTVSKQMIFRTALLCLIALCFGCGNTSQTRTSKPEKPMDPLEHALSEEGLYEEAWTSVNAGRLEARKAAIDYVLATRPNSTIHGVTTTSLSPYMCLIGVDSSIGGRREVVNSIVRRFIADDGSSYWRAEALSNELAGMLAEIQRATFARRRDNAERENRDLDELTDPDESGQEYDF